MILHSYSNRFLLFSNQESGELLEKASVRLGPKTLRTLDEEVKSLVSAWRSLPPFFPATMLLLKAGKKGGHVESTVDDECSPVRAAKLIACSLHSPPFFPATMLLLKAGKKGGIWEVETGG